MKILMVKLIMFLTLSGCSGFSLFKCVDPGKAEVLGFTDGKAGESTQGHTHLKHCKEEEVSNVASSYNIGYERGLKLRCSDSNIESEYLNLGEAGKSLKDYGLESCTKHNKNFTRVSKSAWKKGLKNFCLTDNITSIAKAQGVKGSEFKTDAFKKCGRNSVLVKAKKAYLKGLGEYCSLDNLYQMGYEAGLAGSDISSAEARRCNSFHKDSLSSYIKGYDRGAGEFSQKKLLAEQKKLLETQRSLDEQRRDETLRSRSDYYGGSSGRGGFCRVINNSGTIDNRFCQNSQSGNIRCFIEVEYQDGRRDKLTGYQCVRSFADCWRGRAGAISPTCSR